jgi:hypothetical protein
MRKRCRSRVWSVGSLVAIACAACTTTSTPVSEPPDPRAAPVEAEPVVRTQAFDLDRVEQKLVAHAARRATGDYACAVSGTCEEARTPLPIDDDARALLAMGPLPVRAEQVRRRLARTLLDDIRSQSAPPSDDARALFFDGDAPLLLVDLPALVAQAAAPPRRTALLASARKAGSSAQQRERALHQAIVDESERQSIEPRALLAHAVGLDEATLSSWVDRVLASTARDLVARAMRVDEIPAALVTGALAIDPAHVLAGGLAPDLPTEPTARAMEQARCFVVDGERDVRIVGTVSESRGTLLAARRARACVVAVRAHAPHGAVDPLFVRAVEELSVDVARRDAARGDARDLARLLSLRGLALQIRVILDGLLDDVVARDALVSTWGDARAEPLPGAALLLPPLDPPDDVDAFVARLLARALSRGLASTLGPAWQNASPAAVEDALRSLFVVLSDVGVARYLDTLDDDPWFAR